MESSVEKGRVLVVEDDGDLRVTMAGALSGDGHAVTEAADGRAALDALAGAPFDLVVLDLGLGAGPDGIEVCRRLRATGDDPHVMALTARDGEADIVLALEAGADDSATQPVRLAQLRRPEHPVHPRGPRHRHGHRGPRHR